MEKDKSVIPQNTPYCYSGSRGPEGNMKVCPYWSIDEEKGHCNYLDKTDDPNNKSDYLWDQVKNSKCPSSFRRKKMKKTKSVHDKLMGDPKFKKRYEDKKPEFEKEYQESLKEMEADEKKKSLLEHDMENSLLIDAGKGPGTTTDGKEYVVTKELIDKIARGEYKPKKGK